MAKRRTRKRPSNSSSPKLPQAAQVVGFTDDEEEFFRAGESEPHLEQLTSIESSERPSLWRRLFARASSSSQAA